jgi:hypothetical protein
MPIVSFEFLSVADLTSLGLGQTSWAPIDVSHGVHWAVECTRASFASMLFAVADCGGRFIESGVAGAGELVSQSPAHEA